MLFLIISELIFQNVIYIFDKAKDRTFAVTMSQMVKSF